MNIYSIIPKFLKYIYNRFLWHWINNIVRKSFKRELVIQANFQPPISIVVWNIRKKKCESIFLNKLKNVKDTFLAEFNL